MVLIDNACKILSGRLKKCDICPRRCGVDRTKGRLGYCRAPREPVVYSYCPHFGEEPPLSGTRGSGTIFFSHCNMKCCYCQNYYFSQLDKGKEISSDLLAGYMLSLQDAGCHNINLVSPTHFLPQILLSLAIALKKGLNIPIVYNSGGYELAEVLKILGGVIDIYMPDMRYSDDAMAKKYSDAPQYVKFNREAVKEMQVQTGDLVLDDDGIANKGLLIRLLALPQDIAGLKETLGFIRHFVSPNAYLSIMSQYYPTFKAYNYRELSAGITSAEYKNVVDEARLLGLNNGWIQEMPDTKERRFLGTDIKPR